MECDVRGAIIGMVGSYQVKYDTAFVLPAKP